MSGGLRYNDRAIILGQTRSGKSELLNSLWSGFRSQRVLLDTKDEWHVANVPPSTSVDEIDWRSPVIHFASESHDVSEFDALFYAAYRQRGPMTIAVHELADLCDYQPNRTPPGLQAYLSKGAAHGLGLLSASQRPRQIPTRARSEVEHVFVMARQPDPRDRAEVAELLGMEPEALTREIGEIHERLGEHAFLYRNRRTGERTAWEPLSPAVRAQSLVSRRVPA